MNTAVDAAEAVCCFMTPEYQDSINCKNELQYAKEKNKHIIPCMIGDKENKQWRPTDWLELITAGLNYIDFQEESDPNIRLKTEELINRITNQYSTPAQYSLVNTIKEKYLKEDKIKCILNEEDAFSIEQSYISLAMVNIKEPHEKNERVAKYGMKKISDLRKKQDYHWKHHDSKTLNTFEEIYGDKTPIDIERIFWNSNNPIEKVLILGRPKIGKSTFCQYVTYRWAKGELWSRYELIVLIDFLKLTDTRYPATKLYTVVDLVEREYAPFDNLWMEEKESFLQKCDSRKVLWILDGYDELTANISEQLKQCLNDICEKQNYILTSSSYDIAVSYDVKMEIIGCIHADIPRYVGYFFRQIEGELTNASSQSQKLLDFLYSNRSIYRVASIPVNLELICRLWVDPHQLETKATTMTALYEKFVVWLCRRQIIKDNKNQEQMTKEAVYKQFDKELQLLEYLAFKTVQNDKVILPLNLLQEAAREIGCDLHEHSPVLQMGILKPYDKKSFEHRNETTKQYYFIHPSYQEYFAARHLLKILKSSSDNEAIHFISHQKYNQRFRLMFVFATGLLAESDYQSCIDTFWTTIQGEPIDLGGLQHLQLLTECIDELGDSDVFDNRINILNKLWNLFKTFLNIEANVVQDNLITILSKTSSIPHNTLIQNNLAKLLLISGEPLKRRILSLISQFPVLQPTEKLFSELRRQLRDSSDSIRKEACTALGNIGGNVVTKQLTDALVKALGDNHWLVRIAACEALGKFNENAVTDNVVAGLIKALGSHHQDVATAACDALVKLSEKVTQNLVISGLIHTLAVDENFMVRIRACEALGKIAEKTLTSEMSTALINALGDTSSASDRAHKVLMKFSKKASMNEVIISLIHTLAVHENYWVRKNVCNALRDIAEKAPTNEVLTALIDALGDRAFDVSRTAHEALMRLGEKASTDEVITGLIDALRPNSNWTQICVFQIFGKIGEKAARSDVLTILVNAIGDEDVDVRKNACQALGMIGEKAATVDVIVGLSIALHDNNADVRQNACEILGKIGEKAATNEVLTVLVNAIGNKDAYVRKIACDALEKIGEKAATNEVLNVLVNAIGDNDADVRKNACEILGKIGEKAAANEVLAVLVNAIGDNDADVRKNACQALGKIGEKAAANEVLAVLVNAIGDNDADVRKNACQALGKFGRKAATEEVIAGLSNAFRDKHADVRKNACEALGKIGEKAATNEMLTVLVNAIGDNDANVRKNACEALGKIGKKAVTAEVITVLINALGDWNRTVTCNAREALIELDRKSPSNEVIAGLSKALGDANNLARKNVCLVLREIGPKAATKDVVTALFNELDNENRDVQREAWYALKTFSERAVTKELITVLIEALGSKDSRVQANACRFLSCTDDKTEMDEVITALRNVLNKKDKDMEYWACEALSKISQKAANDDVIDYLVNILMDNNSTDRTKACRTLANMGEKAITDKVLDGLVNTLRDRSVYLRKSACETLGKLGEKAATNKVLVGLINALRDNRKYPENIREDVCKALGSMGEKSATNEVLAGLVNALHDNEYDMDIRKEVCITLGKIGEKAATKAVLEGLIYAIYDKDRDRNAGGEACKTLVKFGEKAATNEVINCLLDALGDKNVDYFVEEEAQKAIVKLGETAKTNQVIACLVERFFDKVNSRTDTYVSKALVGAMNSYAAIKDLDANMIMKLEACLKQRATIELAMMPRDQFIRVFLETRNDVWIPLVTYAALLQNVAVTVMDDKITIYDGKDVAERQVTEPEVLNAFANNRPLYAHITLIPTMTSDFDSHRALLESEESATPDINNRELSCKGHPCPNCGQCRDWYFTGNVAELDWLRNEQHWNHEGSAWNRWCADHFYLKFKPRDGKTCIDRLNFIFPFTVGKYDYGFHPGEGDFPHGPVGYARAIPLAENLPYDYYGYYSDFCICEDNIDK